MQTLIMRAVTSSGGGPVPGLSSACRRAGVVTESFTAGREVRLVEPLLVTGELKDDHEQRRDVGNSDSRVYLPFGELAGDRGGNRRGGAAIHGWHSCQETDRGGDLAAAQRMG